MDEYGFTWILVEGLGAPFYIASTPVTFEQYDRFCEQAGYEKPQDINGRGRLPVVNVSVPDAIAYCQWLSQETDATIRLPEEDEWLFAAMGGLQSRGYEYSGSNVIDDVAWHAGNSQDKMHEVGTKQPNELGIYDMTGNVWEWCGSEGKLRGGAYDHHEDECLLLAQGRDNPETRYGALGFRIARNR